MRNKEIIELSITGVGIVVIGFIVSQQMKGVQRPQPAVSPKTISSAPAALDPKKDKKRLFLALEEEAQNIKLSRDPFSRQPIVFSGDSAHGLNLSGIAWDELKPTAIINDEILAVGDQVAGKRIVEIKKDKVILTDGQQSFELKISIEVK